MVRKYFLVADCSGVNTGIVPDIFLRDSIPGSEAVIPGLRITILCKLLSKLIEFCGQLLKLLIF
jgi:hypothetical protein